MNTLSLAVFALINSAAAVKLQQCFQAVPAPCAVALEAPVFTLAAPALEFAPAEVEVVAAAPQCGGDAVVEAEPACSAQISAAGAAASARAAAGYGTISSRSKGQSQNAARADNEFEAVQENLEYSGTNSESEQGQNESESCLIRTETVSINGSFSYDEDITESQAAQVAESGKSASTFRRESQ